MLNLIKVICLMLISTLIFSVHAETTLDANADMIKKIITAFMQKNKIPGVAVELYIDGKPHSYYFGYANPNEKIPITKKTIFEVGSISKIMTSLLLAEEIDFAKMSLSDSITKSMPDLSNAFDEITLKNLATHTSGLSFDIPKSITTAEELDDYLATVTPMYPSDKKWVYSNFGMGMLGVALERVTHKTIDQLYQRRIASPLGMQSIGMTIPKKWQAYYAQGYDKMGNPVKPMPLDLFAAAWGVKISAGDMQRFLGAAIGLPGTPETIFYPMRMTQTAYVQLPDRQQGLGWHIYPLASNSMSYLLRHSEITDFGPLAVKEVYDKPVFNGDVLLDKTGATAGFHAYMALIPNKKSGVVILANRQVSDDIVKVGREILFQTITETKK